QHEDDVEDRDREAAVLQEKARTEREDSEAKLTALRARYQATASDLSAVRSDRAGAYAQLSQLEGRITKLEGERSTLRTDLAARQAVAADLAKKLKASDARVVGLEAAVRAGTETLASEKAKHTVEKER